MAPHLQDDCYDQLEMEQHSVLSSTPSDNDTLDDMIDSIAMDNVDREEHMYINLGLKEDCCSIQFTASSSSSKDTLKSSKSVMIEESTHTTHRLTSILRRRNSAPSKLQSFIPSSSWSSTKTPPKTNTMHRTSSVVRFPPSYSMVTAQYTRPRTKLVELSKLYYSTEDIKRFKQEYRVERIILARQRQAAQQQQHQVQLVNQTEQTEKDDQAARRETDTTIQIVEENGEVSSLSNSPPTSSQPSTTTSSTSHDNAYWRSKVSRRWGYGRRNSSSSVRTVSPDRKDVPQEDSTSSSCDLSELDPLSSSLTKLLDKPERKSLSYLLDASPAYDSDDESDDDSDSSPTPAPPPKESSSREVGSPKSMFSSAFDHFHHGSTSTMSSRQQCLVDTLYLF